MGRAKFVAIAAFACLTAAIVLAAILCTKSDVRAHFTGPSEDSPPSDELSPPFNERSPSSDQLSPPAPKGSAVGVLTHRDAHHLEGGSPFFARQSVSGRLQPSLAYFEHVMGRQLEGEERRRLASTQQVPINGTLRGSQA